MKLSMEKAKPQGRHLSAAHLACWTSAILPVDPDGKGQRIERAEGHSEGVEGKAQRPVGWSYRPTAPSWAV